MNQPKSEETDFTVIEELNERLLNLESEVLGMTKSLGIEKSVSRQLLRKNKILSQINSEDQEEIESLR